jgi:hypothetical protein
LVSFEQELHREGIHLMATAAPATAAPVTAAAAFSDDDDDDMEDTSLIRLEEEIPVWGGYISPHDLGGTYHRSVERHFKKIGDKRPSVLIAMSIGIEEFKGILTTTPFKDIKQRE